MEEIKEGIEALNNISKIFRHIHVDLKTEFPDYNAKYHDFEKHLGQVIEFIKAAP